jgi:hypothetical protein
MSGLKPPTYKTPHNTLATHPAMRLTPSQQQPITSILRSVDPQAEVLLFGSRANDERKGGDLDIQ